MSGSGLPPPVPPKTRYEMKFCQISKKVAGAISYFWEWKETGQAKPRRLDGNCQWDNGTYANIKFVNAPYHALILPHFLKLQVPSVSASHSFVPVPSPAFQQQEQQQQQQQQLPYPQRLILNHLEPGVIPQSSKYLLHFFCGKVIVLPVFFYLGLSTTSPTARPWRGRRWSRMIISTTITESPGRGLSASSDHEKHIKIPTKNNLSQRYSFYGFWIASLTATDRLSQNSNGAETLATLFQVLSLLPNKIKLYTRLYLGMLDISQRIVNSFAIFPTVATFCHSLCTKGSIYVAGNH